jgi:DNA excision repair protein ERCC-2
MQFDLDQRTANLSVGEFADFTLGPREAAGGPQGLWRAQLGTQWHRQMRERTAAEHPDAEFEIAIDGRVFHRGWTLTLTGRIDQLVPAIGRLTLREIKTVIRPLPADETELRAEYPGYFVQLATYAALRRIVDSSPTNPQLGTRNSKPETPVRPALRAELVFVEVGSGLTQTVVLTTTDDALFRTQLERVAEFLALRQRARERLRHLRFRPPFAEFRPGQEHALAALQAVLGHRQSAILLEAPTGFGKTGVLLEAALTHLRAGHFERVLYLTGKATGQLQVVRTLQAMTSPSTECNPLGYTSAALSPSVASAAGNPAPDDGNPEPETRNPEPETQPATPVAVWVVRPKSEHCVNTTFHCVRATCAYLADMAVRWPRSGLARFYLNENEPRDLASLRAAGREALICPYEITRTALGFNDVWIGDYNYVFAPANRGLFFEQPGFDPARSLLIIDEAHNLPARVADAYSHRFSAPEADLVRAALYRTRSLTQLVEAWDHWTHFLHQLTHRDALALADEDDARDLLEQVAKLVTTVPLDYATLGPEASECLWQVPALVDQLENNAALTRHWWCPRAGELAVTCLDAAPAIGAALREFGGVVLASATFGPEGEYAESLGLDDPPESEPPPPAEPPGRLGQLTKRDTRRLFKQLTSGAELLKVEETRAAAVTCLRAGTPWRDDAYDVAYDLRVDTTFQHRARHYATTAATIVAMHGAAARIDTPPPAPSSSDPAEGCRAASPYRAPEVRHPHAALPSPSGGVRPVRQAHGRRPRPTTQPAIPHAPSASLFTSVAASSSNTIAVFFPSYAYAEAILHELEAQGAPLRVALQQRLADLAAQAAWVEAALTEADALFLVLGSSFAESIDVLGGRVTRAMVIGPALPEVNAVQRARMAALASLGREGAFRRVYQIPGMQKVNQALGRLVRAPGQHAKVLLHCRRFAEPSYAELLDPDYRHGAQITTDAELSAWFESRPPLA